MMRLAVVIAAFVSVGVGQAQSQNQFDGRWRAADAQRQPGTPVELVIRTSASSLLSVERRMESGAQWTPFNLTQPSTGTTPAARARPTASRGSAVLQRDGTLVLNAGAAVQATRSAVSQHEESWTLSGADTLVVQSTDRNATGVTSRSRLTYVRVPRPSSKSGTNLLDNGDASGSIAHWTKVGDATIEKTGGNATFVVRNNGTFAQTVLLPEDIDGRFVAVVGSVSAERINTDGGITGLPSVYGTIGSRDGIRILGYLTQQQMLGRPSRPDEWVTVSGIFKMPPEADLIGFSLKLASAKDVPQNGSAGRFDDFGVYVFGTELEARTFIKNWRGR